MNVDFASLIVAETKTINSSYSDRIKLNRLGKIYCDYARHLDCQSQELLDLATQPAINSSTDTIIDESFEEYLDSWLRSSVSGNFLNEFLTPIKRKPYELSNLSVEELDESAIAEIVELDISKEVLAIADPEDIKLWSECLLATMKEKISYQFSELIDLTELTPAQVFLALFLSDRFQFLDSDTKDFYRDFSVAIRDL